MRRSAIGAVVRALRVLGSLHNDQSYKETTMRTLLVITLLFTTHLALAQLPEKAMQTLDKMIAAVDKNTTLTATLQKSERWDGKMVHSKMRFKVQYEPFSMYMYNLAPANNQGVEILYKEGFANNKAYVNPNGFPWKNLWLDPDGAQLRKKGAGHHSFLVIGYQFIGDLAYHYRAAYKNSIKEHVRYLGETSFDGRKCHVVELFDNNFHYDNYTVKSGESAISIANKLHVSEDMIVQVNPEVDWFWDLQQGQVIKVPNAYGKRIRLHICKTTHLPVEILVFDDQGKYEHYRYYDMVVNPKFAEDEFSVTNDEYDF